jgi:hypothetical protein
LDFDGQNRKKPKSHFHAFKGGSGDVRFPRGLPAPSSTPRIAASRPPHVRLEPVDLRRFKAKSQHFRDDTSIGGHSNSTQRIKKKPSRRESSVKSTAKVRKKVSKKDGIKMINQYTIE